MKDRILAFLQNENKTYAQFAEEIGVQPSGISHILSGRNNPSLEFVIKMLHRYPSLSSEWLLFGRGPMYKYASQPTLFEDEATTVSNAEENQSTDPDVNEITTHTRHDVKEMNLFSKAESKDEPQGRKLTRVLLFYSDKTFSEYMPS